MMTFGERIKEYRRKAGLTVGELAERLHVSRQTVFRYENGQIATVPSDKLKLLGEILSVSPAVLIGSGNDKEFTVIAEDDRMAGSRLRAGDTVYCRPSPLRNGMAAVLQIDGRTVILRCYVDRVPDKVLFLAENPAYPPLILDREAAESALIGEAYAFRGNL